MKRCPQCNRVETDEALKFCRVDGTTLTSDSGAVADDASTAKFGADAASEIETSVLPHTTDVTDSRATAATSVLFAEVCTDFAPYDFASAKRELRHAIELSPSLAMSYQHLGVLSAREGRFDEALENFLKARKLDPLSPIIARQVSLPYYLKGDYPHALELLRQANELGVPLTSTWEVGIYIQNRSFDEALAELEKAKQGRKNDPILIYGTGMIYAAQGKRESALQVIKELEAINGSNLSQAQWLAKIYATLNEKDEALTWLERGLATGATQGFFKDDPVWGPIRDDRRFTDLLRRMGIPQ